MPRTILVSEGDSPLGAALVRLLAARGYGVVAAHGRAAEDTALGVKRSPLTVAWNRRSPVSARTVVLSTLNALGSIDEAVILEPPCAPGSALPEAASADIERVFDDAKGPVFLAREFLVALRARSGVLCFVSGGAAAGPLEGAAREAFRGLASAVLAAPGNGVIANAFQGGAADPEEYAAFIDRTLEEKARKITGRWFTFPSRGGFLQGVLKTSLIP